MFIFIKQLEWMLLQLTRHRLVKYVNCRVFGLMVVGGHAGGQCYRLSLSAFVLFQANTPLSWGQWILFPRPVLYLNMPPP